MNGGFLLPWKPQFWSNLPQNLCSHSPTPVMLHIKFDQDWPTGFRDIQVWMCGRRRTTTTDDDGRRRTTTTDGDGRATDHWYTISSPCEHSLRWAKNADAEPDFIVLYWSFSTLEVDETAMIRNRYDLIRTGIQLGRLKRKGKRTADDHQAILNQEPHWSCIAHLSAEDMLN